MKLRQEAPVAQQQAHFGQDEDGPALLAELDRLLELEEGRATAVLVVDELAHQLQPRGGDVATQLLALALELRAQHALLFPGDAEIPDRG